MRIALNDIVYATSTLQTPQEYIVLILLVLYMVALLYTLIRCLMSDWIDLRSKIGQFSIAVLLLCIGWEILCFLILYKDWDTKLIGLLFALVGGTVALIFILGLLDLLKGFSDHSRYITTKRIKFAQLFGCILYLVCVGPHYYLFWFLETKRPDIYPVKVFNYS